MIYTYLRTAARDRSSYPQDMFDGVFFQAYHPEVQQGSPSHPAFFSPLCPTFTSRQMDKQNSESQRFQRAGHESNPLFLEAAAASAAATGGPPETLRDWNLTCFKILLTLPVHPHFF